MTSVRKNPLPAEMVGSLLGAVALLAWLLRFDGAYRINDYLGNSVVQVHSTLAEVCASLFGLLLATEGIVLTAVGASDVLRRVRRERPDVLAHIFAVFHRSQMTMGIGLLAALGLMWTRDGWSAAVLYAVLGWSIALGSVTLAHAVWYARRLVRIAADDTAATGA